jgi:hypothetical protein
LTRQNHKPLNIFDLRPKQLYPSELVEKGKIVILVPKSQSKIVEWFMPKKNRTNIRVKLDILGSFIWDSCDGTMTVKDIANKMKEEYGTIVEPVDMRVSSYIQRLHTHRFIDVGLENDEKSQFYQKK